MLKRNGFWGLFVIVALVVIGIRTLAETPPPDYFPLPMGGVWEYQVNIGDGKPSQLTVQVEGLETQADGTILYKTKHNLGFDPYYIWYAKSNGLVQEYRQVYAFEGNYTEYRSEPVKPILKNPPTSGETWTWEGQQISIITIPAKENYRVLGIEEIEVPAGKFATVKVEIQGTKAETPFKKVFWYGNLIGPIKWEVFDNQSNLKITAALEKYTFPSN